MCRYSPKGLSLPDQLYGSLNNLPGLSALIEVKIIVLALSYHRWANQSQYKQAAGRNFKFNNGCKNLQNILFTSRAQMFPIL
jgi:hypothetical protein